MTNNLDINFCKVLVKKSSDNSKFEKYEEPLIDVIDEGENIKLLVQGRCFDKKFSIHLNKNRDGITICKEKCIKKNGMQKIECSDVCSKNIPLNVKELQLEEMLFLVSTCNNNNTLEIMIPKIKKQ